ncbi:probable E3 ubiquitin-protein ligase makorin-1 [Chelonus insularis]|uniref:probable E3 ubiquitin-protein ligase makorin-1 n=1 Tax=Chelonus insularis TaxID=460826 RepID=UPI00158B7F36|nr:probable E3 ubiquitin-protein ligase makorin-1 [Chelonus insularis]
MADDWTRAIVCRYYKNGLCREGDNCRYRHADQQSADREEMTDDNNSDNSTNVLSSVIVCRFFKWGTCKFGSRCRYKHISNNHTVMSEQESDESKPESRKQSSSTAFSSTDAAHSSQPSSSSHSTENTEANKYEPHEWIKAPEFIPQSIAGNFNTDFDMEESIIVEKCPKSYARAVNSSGRCVNSSSEPLCPYAEATGICTKLKCPYLHGDICELCGRAALHPYNEEQRQQHNKACIKQHEVDMELSFAIQRSRGKACGVCFEVVMEKASRDQRRFGILPNCNHCFCLSCIRKWRQAKQFENKIIRSCPECRVTSDFVCPSIYWVDTKEEKEKLIVEYKGALSQKDCKYFNKGQGKCPFGNKCFYLHALPDGTKTDVGPPSRQTSNSNGDFLHQLILWNFLEERDDSWIYMDEDDEVVMVFSDSEDSDWSRYGSYD